MSTLTLELPDELASGLERLVKAGWFIDQNDAVRAALRDLVSDQRFATAEQQQIDDIEWANPLVDLAKNVA